MTLNKKPVPKKCQTAAEEFARSLREQLAGYTWHCILMCDTCGHMRWNSSSNDSVGVTVRWMSEDMSERQCSLCMEVRHRAPELGLWVVSAINMLEARLEGMLDERGKVPT